MTRVLIVDDERNIHKAYCADIQAAADRYELVDTIVSAADAIMVCSAKHIDLVLMDINTAKNENGIEATKRIKKSCPKIKIIVTTSYTDPQALKDAKAAGADSFWFKDFSPIELLEVMDRTMDGRCYWPEEAPDVELGNTTIGALTETEKEVLHNLVECISLKKNGRKNVCRGKHGQNPPEKHLSESGLCEQNRASGSGNAGKTCIAEEAGKLNYIMRVIIFGTRFRVPFLFSSEISYFWGKKKKKQFDKI